MVKAMYITSFVGDVVHVCISELVSELNRVRCRVVERNIRTMVVTPVDETIRVFLVKGPIHLRFPSHWKSGDKERVVVKNGIEGYSSGLKEPAVILGREEDFGPMKVEESLFPNKIQFSFSIVFDVSSDNASHKDIRKRVVDDFERQFVSQAMAATFGNKSKASRLLSMDRKHFHDLVVKHFPNGWEPLGE